MPWSRKDLRSLPAIFGVMILLATLALSAATIRPTEAIWQDTVTGQGQFGTSAMTGENYARAMATYGTMTRSVSGNELRGPIQSAVTSASGPPRAETPAQEIRSPFGTATLPVNTTARTCARAGLGDECAPEPADPTPKPANHAVAELNGLEVFTFRVLFPTIPLVSYDESAPIRATASCTPGSAGQAAVSTGGSIVLGDRALSNRVSVPVPTTPGVSGPVTREWGAYNYQATVIHDRVEQMHHAASQVRLVIEATAWSDEGERWALNIILARAECGVSMSMPPEPPRPSTSGLGRTAAAPATVQTLDEQAGNGSTAENLTTDRAETREGTPEENEPSNEARDAIGGTTAPTTSAPPTHAPDSDSRTTSAEPPPSPPPSNVAVEQPQDARIGREFSVVTREGVELGTARIEGVARLPACGVEITLEITTTAEDGPGRWASIDHRDFAEVHPGGSIRPAQRASSKCASSADSEPAELTAGGVHEAVLVIQVSDTAQRAMFRPERTAGWRFDLPPLPTRPQASAPPQGAAVISVR